MTRSKFLYLFLCAFHIVSSQDVCGPNEEFKDCGLVCACEQRDKLPCPIVCRPGCFCKPRFKKDRRGNCVREEQCPARTHFCRPDEEFQACGTACPPTCVDRGVSCAEGCVRGCFCKSGLLRDEDGNCVTSDECDRLKARCPGRNEQFSTCVIPCNTCAEKGRCFFPTCNKGCDCRRGFLRNEFEMCISENWCPM